MSLLFAMWVLSAGVVLATLGMVFFRVRGGALVSLRMRAPSNLGEFFTDQLHEVLVRFFTAVHHIKPHARQLGMTALLYTKKGHDLFVERVFGRIELPRGGTVSFFLKHIAEHKEMNHRDGEDAV